MNIQKYILTLLFMLLATVQMAAQGLVVKQFYHAERDFTANSGSTIVLDANEQPCALIKVRTNEHGFTFDSGRLLPIEKTEEQTKSHPLEIYVWVQSGAKRLSIGHKQLGNLYDYDLGQHLRSGALEAGQTYILELVSGEVQTIVKQARTSQYVVFQLTPPDAVVKLDGQMLKTIDGTAQKLMPFGSYQYTVEAPDYKLEVGRIQVNDPDSAHTVRVQLKPDIAQITISVPDGAEIWVNGEKKGIGSWAGNLGAGMYILEAKKAGHRDTQRSVTIDPDAGAQTITLDAPRPIYGEADITSEPAMADIYIDGQQVGKTPRIVPKLTIGTHSVKLVRSGYADYTGTLTIKEGETASLRAPMKKGGTSAIAGGSTTAGTVSNIAGNTSGNITANTVADASSNLSFTVKGVTFTMVKVEAGTFMMGATEEQGDDAWWEEEPAHKVTHTKDYYIGQTEVTQALWQAVMGSNPSHFEGNNLPVECVCWDDCQAFITKLNSLTKSKFRLPTEAEWEYAARGGKKSRGYKYSGSNSNDQVAWYYVNSGNNRLDDFKHSLDLQYSNKCQTHPVGTKSPNELGIYDMSGNVYEWCYDFFDDYSSDAQTDPTGPTSGSNRVIRGGGWEGGSGFCRVSSRGELKPDADRVYYAGLRLCLGAPTN